MAGTNFEPVEPFGVDHGELDGITPAECFTLGVEWEMVRAAAESGAGFIRLIRATNAPRVRAILDRRGRAYRLTFMADDVSEQWMRLAVEPNPG